ncbi:MAG: hypothetical protein V1649_02465 [Patescibacteria group bacterium]
MNNDSQNDKNKIMKLKKAIIKVIVFFDMFDYPLTVLEIWQNLEVKCELLEVMMALENEMQPLYPPCQGGSSNLWGKIKSENGFYFLSGREKNIIERMDNYNFADRKFKRARFVAKIFKFIPWIKMIGVNSFGSRNLRDNGDIDLFIITDDKRIWLTRFFCVGIIKLLGLRPQLNNNLDKSGSCRDKICLSFYVSLSALNLEKLRLGQDDLGFTYWLAGLTLIYNINNAHQKLVNANQWLVDILPNWFVVTLRQNQMARDSGGVKINKPFYTKYKIQNTKYNLDGLESRFKFLQLKILPQKLKSMMNRDSRVVINDQIIKLHSNDRRDEYIKKMTNYEIFRKNN